MKSHFFKAMMPAALVALALVPDGGWSQSISGVSQQGGSSSGSGSGSSASGGVNAGSRGRPSGNSSSATSTSGQPGMPNATQALQNLHDAQAMNYIQHVNQREIVMANMAAGKLQSSSLQSINQQILQDHQNGLATVQDTANSLGILIVAYQPASYELAEMIALNRLQGSSFDAAYQDVQRVNHQVAIQVLQQMQNQSLNPQVKQLIDQFLPVMQQHLSLVSGGSSNATGASGASGSTGTSVTTGASGASGSSGASDTTGASGSSGTSTTTGASGSSGSSGTSTTTGASGSSGSSGTSTTTGASGSSGSSGASATTGASGGSGASGTSVSTGDGSSVTGSTTSGG